MEITEDWIRGLTGWKPFKEGKSKAEQGLVTGYKQTGAIYQGALRSGRVNLRPIVKVIGPSEVRVQCGCADNRSTGGVCAHAVAVLLTGLKSPTTEGTPTSKNTPKSLPQAWNLRFSPRMAAELGANKLSVRLLPCEDAITSVDVDLSAWLDSQTLRQGAQPIALRLAGPEVADFLQIAAGHPRVEIDGRPGPFQFDDEPGPPLQLSDSRLEGSQVVLELSPDESRRDLVPWGESMGIITERRAYRLPGRSDTGDWLKSVDQLAANGRLKLSIDTFLSSFDAWSDLLQPPHPGWLGSLRLAAADPDFELELEGSLESLDAVLKVRYPGMSARQLPEPGEDLAGLPRLAPDGHLVARSSSVERQARHRMLAMGFKSASAQARFRLTGRDSILAFIADELPDLRDRWSVREGERFSTLLKRVHVVRPDIQETTSHRGSLEFDLSFQTTGGKRIPSDEMRRILRGGKRTIRLKSGADLVVSRTCEDLVNPMIEELGIGRPDERIQLSGASAIVLRNLRAKLDNSRVASDSEDFHHASLQRVSVVGLDIQLRGYQEDGSAWLLDRLSQLQGALLADEMGLGKTAQTIAVINHLKRSQTEKRGLVLVIAPTSLLGNWIAELNRFAPGLKCILFHGSGRDSLRAAIPDCDVIVTSYGTLTRDLAFHLQQEYRLVVADEASLLRNPDAEISKALVKIKSQGRLALTGTPVENRMQDLWSIFRFVAPGYLGSRADFKERYETPAKASESVSPELLERLRLRVSPFVLRRTKEEVAKDLPDKVEIDEWLTMPNDQSELYTSLARAGLDEVARIREQQGDGAGQMHLLTLLLRLRQICVDPGLLEIDPEKEISAVKMTRLFELLKERSENGSKTLVFSQFARNLRRIEKRISDGFGRVFCIDGSTRKRQELVDGFQQQVGPAVFLISLKAGGYGLNLTAADAVVHLDPWWNPAVEAQATDRAHRIGQTRPVTVYRFLTRDTVEERVRQMQERKRAVINAATGDAENGIPQNWSGSDIEDLLR